MSDKTLGPWDGTGPLPTGMGTTRTAPVLEENPVAPTPDEIVADSTAGEPVEIIAEPVDDGAVIPAGAATMNGEPAPVGEDGIPILVAADEDVAPAGAAVTDAGFEPGDHNVEQVRKYLSANPDQAGFVLDRERAGKSRTSLIGA